MEGVLLGNLGKINYLLGKPWRSSHKGSYPEELGTECMLEWWGGFFYVGRDIGGLGLCPRGIGTE